MKRRMLTIALASGLMLALAGPAAAQIYPGYGNYGGFGDGWGTAAAALTASTYQQTAIMQGKQESMQAGQQLAAQQNAVVQSGIRNTLSNQAQANIAAAQNQQQATQDWWFQHQTQQLAQEQARRQYASGNYSPAASGIGPVAGPPPANMDIIKWPTLLQEQCFAGERAKIEAPYRRTPPKLSIPTPADYRSMAAVVEDMKAVLEWRLTDGADTGEYNTAKAFLDRLGQEVTSRADASGRTS
jgi:hypothetical protein